MKKVLGLALALLVTGVMSAAAEEVKGTVKAVNPADHSIVLDAGTKLTVSDRQLSTLTAGDQVRGGKRMVTELVLRGMAPGASGTPTWRLCDGNVLDSSQAEERPGKGGAR